MADTRKEKNRKRNIDDILEATANLIAQKGIQGVSVDDIAKEADFGKGTLYNYFSSKDDIIMSLIESVFKGYVGDIKETVDDSLHIKDKMREVLKISFGYFEKQAAINEILAFLDYSAWKTQCTNVSKCACEFFNVFHEPFAEMFSLAIERGEIRKHDPYLLSHTFFALVSAMKKCKINDLLVTQNSTDEEMLEILLNLFFEKI
jgi:AcrR family transcriptional regulator